MPELSGQLASLLLLSIRAGHRKLFGLHSSLLNRLSWLLGFCISYDCFYIRQELYHRTPAPKAPACLLEVERHLLETPPAPVNPLKQNKLVRKSLKKGKKAKKGKSTKHKKVFRDPSHTDYNNSKLFWPEPSKI